MEKLCIKCNSANVIEIMNNNLIFFKCQDCGHTSGQTIYNDGRIIQTMMPDGRIKHASVAAIIKRDGKYLLAKRRVFEFGYGNISGHIEYGETPLQALKREVFEETGMEIKKAKLVFHQDVDGDKCRAGADIHNYSCFMVEGSGEPVKNHEASYLGWYAPQEIKKLDLIYVARLVYRHLGVI